MCLSVSLLPSTFHVNRELLIEKNNKLKLKNEKKLHLLKNKQQQQEKNGFLPTPDVKKKKQLTISLQ